MPLLEATGETLRLGGKCSDGCDPEQRGTAEKRGCLYLKAREFWPQEKCPKHQGLLMGPGEGPEKSQPKTWRGR